VNLVVSLGRAVVPNVLNQLQAAAETYIANAGLTAGTITSQWHDTIVAGNVISNKPVGAPRPAAARR